MERRVDVTALKVNQAFIVGITVLAFVLNLSYGGQWLVLALAVVLAVGTAVPDAALFKQLYARVLRPAGLLRPNVVPEDPMPHLFAQGVGATFLVASFVFLIAGLPWVGWALSWVVTVLAFINLAFSFCAGCFMWYQLDRVGMLPKAISSQRAG